MRILRSLNPRYVMSEWVEHGLTPKRPTVSNVLPSGINCNCTILVSPGGNNLLFSVNWPGSIINLQQLRGKLLTSTWDDSTEMYLSKLVGFGNFLKEFRERKINHNESVATLLLLIQGQSQLLISSIFLGLTEAPECVH